MSTPLQLFVKSTFFNFIGYCFILLNCFVLALYTPLKKEAYYLKVLNLFVDTYFCVEFIVRFVAFGSNHFTSIGKKFDLAVSAVSFGDIILFVVRQFVDKGGNAVRYLQLIRVISIFRPLGMLQFFPPTSEQGHIIPAVYDLVVTAVIPLLALVAFCMMSFGLVSNSILYRCVPSDLTSPNVLDNPYYQEFGLDYFYSQYNVDFCGYKLCEEGYTCTYTHLPYAGVYASFLDPWQAFISNMAFVTMRGWPNIFWAIHDSNGVIPAIIILAVIFCVGTLLLFNMYIAVFVGFLKDNIKSLERLIWLRLYPGNLEAVTELELLLWAKRNLSPGEMSHTVNNGLSVRALVHQVYLFVWGEGLAESTNAAAAAAAAAVGSGSKKKATKKLSGGSSGKYSPVPRTGLDTEAAGVELSVMRSSRKSKESKDSLTSEKVTAADLEVEAALKERKKLRLCVPNCAIFKTIRQHIKNPHSVFNIVVLTLILLNILFFAMDGVNVNSKVEQAIYYANIIFASIFGLEITFYLIVMGPFLYFNSLFNILDFTCVVLTLASLRFGGCRYANIFRILRIFRPAPTRPRGTLSEEIAYRKHLRDTSLHFSRLTELLYLSVKPCLKYFTLQYCAIFVFALIGMRIFPFNYNNSTDINSNLTVDGVVIEPITANNDTLNLAYQWSGQYQDKLNFNIFSNAYQTTFDLLYLNSWYYVMINNMLKSGMDSFWFFFIWIFFSNYILAPVLSATLIVGVESQSVAMLKAISYENKMLFERLHQYKRKSELYRSFHIFKRNTQAIGGGVTEDGVVRHIELKEAEDENIDRDTWWQKMTENRKDYACFLFAPKNLFRRYCAWMVKSSVFNMFVLIAVLLTIIEVLATSGSQHSTSVTLEVYMVVVFFMEMFMKWIAYGVYPCFMHVFRVIDFLLNLLIIYQYSTGDTRYSGFLIVRIIKLPAMFYHISKSKSLNTLMRAAKKSFRSILTVVGLLLMSCLFFAVLGLSLYKGGFGYCSYSDYPGGRHWHDRSGSFPNGCDGLTSITDPTTGEVTTQNLYWIQPIDNFDNIFHAGKSVFRVVMMNDWAGIMLSAVSYVGVNLEPIRNYNSASFLYFMFMSMLSTVFNILFACVIYFHYYTELLMDDSRAVLSQDEVIWIQLKVALSTTEPYLTPKLPTLEKAPIRFYLLTFMQGWFYKALSIAFAFVPIILLLGFYEETYQQTFFLYVDNLFSAGYIFDYLLRLYVNGQWKIWSSAEGAQEIVIVAFLVVSILTLISTDSTGTGYGNLRQIVFTCIVLRFYRLSAVFPTISKFTRIFALTLRSFAPLLMTVFACLIFYGVIGTYAFQHLDLGFTDQFLAEHYNFNGFFNSMITLLAMCTGNFYTEVVSAVKATTTKFQDHVAQELFFTSFYIIMNILMRATVLICVTKYLSESGDAAYAANEQINHFKRLWRRMRKPNDDPYTMKHKRVGKFLANLKYPLGIKGTKDSTTFVVIERFKQKVLRYTAENMAEQERRLMYMMANSGRDDSRHNDKNDHKKRYKFNELILACHKNFILNDDLDDEQEFQAKRAVHKTRLKLFRLHLAMLILSGRVKEVKDVTLRAAQMQLMLQRFDPELYKETFIRLMNFIHTYLVQSIQSLGFEDFNGFIIIYIRKAVMNEHKAAESQVKKHQLLLQSETNKQARSELVAAQTYYAAVAKLSRMFDTLYNRHIQQLWDIETLHKLCTIPEKKSSVTAVALDSFSHFCVAYDTGKVKYWRNNAANGMVTKDSMYRPFQTLDFGGVKIKAMALSNDGKRLYVAVNNTVIVHSNQKSKKKKNMFEEISKMKFHGDTVNAIVLFNNFVLTASTDGYVALWPVGSETPLQTSYMYSSVFAIAVMRVADENAVADDILLSDILACGLQSGVVNLLPLPLAKSGVKEGDSWTYSSLVACQAPVSAICSAWGFLFVGCADGIVNIYAKISTKEGTVSNPIAAVSLVKVSCQTVHAGAITSMIYSGGHLISSSHDFSILPWTAPTKLSAKTSNEFHQDMCEGIVFHESSIVSMTSNSKVIVSGDDSGNVVITIPVSSQEILSSGKALGYNSAKNKCRFSFYEHDFKECICSHKGAITEEDVYLNISNTSCAPITVRAVPKGGNVFKVTFDEDINLALGCKVVSLPSIVSGSYKTALEIPVNGCAQYRCTFSPVEADKHYGSLFDFVVDGTSVVKVNLKGIGIKPVVRLDNVMQIIDFDLVEVDAEPKTIVITLFNQCNRDVTVNLNDTPVKDEHGSNMHTLASRHIIVEPRCFFMEKKSTVKVSLTYAPKRAMLAFDLPLKFNVAGASYQIAKLRTRSRRKADVNLSPGEKSDHLVSFSPNVTKAFPGLRLLTSTENFCPGDSVNALLNQVGWGVGYQPGMLCLMHQASGLFIHVPRGAAIDDIDDDEDPKTLLQQMRGNDKIEVQFLCAEPQHYELWCRNKKIASGFADQDRLCTIVVNAGDITGIDEDGVPVQLYGAQVLELFLADEAPSLLVGRFRAGDAIVRSITYINIQKGYIVRAPVLMTDPFKLVEQLDIIGIHKVTTFLDKGVAALYENFDQMLVENTKVTESSAVFGAVKLALNPTSCKEVTHYEVRDTITLCDPITGATVRDFEQSKVQAFDNANDLAVVDVKLPEMGTLGSELNGVVRALVIKMVKRGRDSAGKSTHSILERVETEVHTMKYAGNSPTMLGVNQILTKNALNSLLPTAVHSCQHSVAVKLPNSTHPAFTEMQGQIRSGYDYKFHEETSIHNNRYFFVVENTRLKLLSGNPTWPIMVDDSAILGDDASVAGTKKSKASKKSVKEHHSTPRPQFSSFELEFHSTGLLAIMNDFENQLRHYDMGGGDDESSVTSEQSGASRSTVSTAMSSLAMSVDNGITSMRNVIKNVANAATRTNAPAINAAYEDGVINFKGGDFVRAKSKRHLPIENIKAIKITSCTGNTTRLEEPPRFLSQSWDSVAASVLADDIKAAFKKLMVRYEAQSGNVDIAKGFSGRMYNALTAITNEHHDKYVEEKNRLAGITTPTSKPSTTLNITKMQLFMETVALPGNDVPLSKAQLELGLRGLQVDVVGNVAPENIRAWFDAKSTKKELASLNERTVYARLLVEDIEDILAWSVANHQSHHGVDYEDSDDEIEEEFDVSGQFHPRRLPRVETSLKSQEEIADRRKKMNTLWNQRLGVSAKSGKQMKASRYGSSYMGLTDDPAGLRAKLTAKLREQGKSGTTYTHHKRHGDDSTVPDSARSDAESYLGSQLASYHSADVPMSPTSNVPFAAATSAAVASRPAASVDGSVMSDITASTAQQGTATTKPGGFTFSRSAVKKQVSIKLPTIHEPLKNGEGSDKSSESEEESDDDEEEDEDDADEYDEDEGDEDSDEGDV